ncbi:hypothetical protein E2C01_010547 [Portunus trituberculatus]|uniref:Uncharacterized protein n=1 Tax=Portunus trituberculatus TaxID=210409 RepID=A0A5B7D8Y4_PORTR|nr:hypothetical protein [Portunus trituberculatus]
MTARNRTHPDNLRLHTTPMNVLKRPSPYLYRTARLHGLLKRQTLRWDCFHKDTDEEEQQQDAGELQTLGRVQVGLEHRCG